MWRGPNFKRSCSVPLGNIACTPGIQHMSEQLNLSDVIVGYHCPHQVIYLNEPHWKTEKYHDIT